MRSTMWFGAQGRWYIVMIATLLAAPSVSTARAAPVMRADSELTQRPPAQSTRKDAEQVVSQPAKDVGIEKTSIPPLLIEVSKDPYGTAGTASCQQIAAGIEGLNNVLGTDFAVSAPAKKRNIAKAGGAAVVNSLIPFRGLVREVSGAAPAERRLDAATKAGFARRGFLRGLQRARNCRVTG